MSEWENSEIFHSGYGPDIEITRLDLYRLINQFLASKTLSNICEEDWFLSEAMSSLDHFFEVEATRILLSSAVIARVIDDRENHLKNFDTCCGKLIKNISNPEDISDLCLREACNKIIHAKKINYDVEVEIHGSTQRCFNPLIYYYGTHGSKKWKAILNVVDYVKHFTNNVIY
jgi:hypothetical protein